MDFDSILHQYQMTYYKLPCGVKKFLGSLYGNIPLSVRFGKNYTVNKKILFNFLNANEQYQLDYQYIKTYETLHFAYDNIPYYRELFDKYNFKLEDFKELNDIYKLPNLTKEIIQKNLEVLYTNKFDKPTSYYTGGSSSTPMKIYAPRSSSRAKEKVYFQQAFSQLGYNYRNRTVSMMARGNAKEEKRIYWEYQNVDNYLLVSVNHLKKEFILDIVAEINRYQPVYFHAYPSAVITFIKACKSVGIHMMERIQGVALVSESISLEQIEFIQVFFNNASILSHYGHTERIVSAYRIDNGRYHFYNAYGLSRIVNNEIVGTSFDNLVMPYINYKTNDFVVGDLELYDNTNEIVKSVTGIQGRLQEFVVTKDETVIPLLSIGAGHFDSYDYIDKTQFYQDIPGKIILYIQTSAPERINIKYIVSQMEKQVQNKISFDVKIVDSIKNTGRRKNILCIQKLDIEKYMSASK